jgi:hypothetical protein
MIQAKGTYRFYQNGRLVGQSDNIITTAGRRAILQYLAGRGGSVGSSLALGTGSAVATIADKRLTFEVDRATIDVLSALYDSNYLVFKATIPQDRVFTIYEVGLFNLPQDGLSTSTGRVLASFETGLETWSAGTYTTTVNARVGGEALRLQPAGSGTVETILDAPMDLGSYTIDDNFTIAFYKNSSNASSLILKFKNANGDNFSLSKSINALPNGYNIVTFRKGDFTASSLSILWSDLTQVSISHSATAGGASDIYLDGMRVEDDDYESTDYALTSRSVLATPVVKSDVSPMDIEYALELAFV